MAEDEEKKPEEKPEEKKPEEPEKPKSVVEIATEIRDDITKIRDEVKTEKEGLQKVQSEMLLSGTAGGHIEAKSAPETAKEYVKREFGWMK